MQSDPSIFASNGPRCGMGGNYELLAENSSCDVRADSVYRSEDHEIVLAATGDRSHVHKKGYKVCPFSKRD